MRRNCIYKGEYIQRHLEESSAGKESSRLDMTSIPGLGHERRERGTKSKRKRREGSKLTKRATTDL